MTQVERIITIVACVFERIQRAFHHYEIELNAGMAFKHIQKTRLFV